MERSDAGENIPPAEELMKTIHEETGQRVDERTAQRFYDRVRKSIERFLARKGDRLGRAKEFLFLVPDVFILLWRLANDKRVSGKNKVLLGTGIAYFLFPLDVMPEALMGPLGFLDDLVFAAYILNRLLADTDEQVLREHWSGSEDVLSMIRRVLQSADSLVPRDFLNTIKKWMK